MTLDELNAQLDAYVMAAKTNGASVLDAAMIDKVVRPISVLIYIHREAETDPDEFIASMSWGIGVALSEMVLNLSDKHNPNGVMTLANNILQSVAKSMQNAVNESLPNSGRAN